MSTYNALTKNEQEETKQEYIMVNIRSVIFYALSLSVALGFNDLIVTVFDSFSGSQHIISKTTYVVILFGVTLLIADWLAGTIKT